MYNIIYILRNHPKIREVLHRKRLEDLWLDLYLYLFPRYNILKNEYPSNGLISRKYISKGGKTRKNKKKVFVNPREMIGKYVRVS